MKKVLILLIILTSIKLTKSQNEANVWYFQDKCGLDFNAGVPIVLNDGPLQNISANANATIADSLGNFLFCVAWTGVFTSQGIMQNSENMYCPGVSGLAIVKWPGKAGTYFIFTAVLHNMDNPGFYYSVVDLGINNGQGAITEKNVPIESGWDVNDRIAVVKSNYSELVWVIVRKNIDDAFAVYRVDGNGFHPEPVLSVMPDGSPGITWEGDWGYIKLSSNKKFLVSSYDDYFEVCSFNASNGIIQYMYTVTGPISQPYGAIYGIEFAPDAKYLYISSNMSNDTNYIYQYNMQLISDSSLFSSSALLVGKGNGFELQLARDGKIYLTPNYFLEGLNKYNISVINKPWINGAGCEYENNSISLFPHKVGWTFPNILVDYLLRFEWTGEPCQGYPIQFKPNFIPTPQTIKWDFDDGGAPGSISWQLSPTYSFKNPGVHEVQVDVWYPSGRYEHTSRVIEISPSPQPDLGPDTLICNGASITLNANCEADFFSWSTSQFGVSSITVSDSGTYWVRGRFNESGCMGYDTIHVGFHPPAQIDETSLIVTPTTCNGASGSITGLAVIGMPPFIYRWVDLSEVEFGTDIDVSGLPAGQYYLTITDANGCETTSNIYTIEDAGNLQVLNVELIQPHCGRPDGQIVVHAFSPSGSTLEYSIDDGASYSSDSLFTGLSASTYVVHIRDVNGCEGFYLANPVDLANIPGPQIQPPVVTDETDFLGNGSIEITATGSTPQIFFSIDNGITWQTNIGIFNNLFAGTYTCIVKDENNCDTTFTIEIQNIILTYLHAITGPGGHCLGNTAMVPVNVDNFNAVATFHLKLSYNADNLQCEGFTNVQPQLLDSLTGWVDQSAGVINLAWNSPSPITFAQPETVAELVFTTKNPGQGELSWYTGTTESYFTNSTGNPIPAEFQTGEVKIYEPPEIILDQSKTVCEGQLALILGTVDGNQPPISYSWIYPAGDTTSNDPFFFNVTPADAGLYTLLATDRVGCTDQKSIQLIVSENPIATFHGTDTLEMQAGDVLDAGEGMASYKWNTGDTTESIIIPSVGMYSVEMESPVGCVGRDSIYVKLASEEIPDFDIYIPNAFSPNADGINDIFKITFPNSTFNIQNSTLSIFDRWGGMVYTTNDFAVGWDGKKNGNPCPGGVYVYKIVFSVDSVPGNQERVGTVALVR